MRRLLLIGMILAAWSFYPSNAVLARGFFSGGYYGHYGPRYYRHYGVGFGYGLRSYGYYGRYRSAFYPYAYGYRSYRPYYYSSYYPGYGYPYSYRGYSRYSYPSYGYYSGYYRCEVPVRTYSRPAEPAAVPEAPQPEPPPPPAPVPVPSPKPSGTTLRQGSKVQLHYTALRQLHRSARESSHAVPKRSASVALPVFRYDPAIDVDGSRTKPMASGEVKSLIVQH